MANAPDSTKRFSNRVENYVKYRPGYPDDVVELLRREAGMAASAVIADVGAGTGISCGLFLRHGHGVFGVEPNREMREAAERLLSGYPKFRSVNGTANATTLPDASVDFVVAAQAFHWFDAEAARREFARILKPGGKVVLMWNTRLDDVSEFARQYEAMLHQYGTDYANVDHRHIDEAVLSRFFKGGTMVTRKLANEQVFDFAGIRGRLLSSSYAPAEGEPNCGPMLERLRQIFDENQEDGRVKIDYETEVFWGEVSGE